MDTNVPDAQHSMRTVCPIRGDGYGYDAGKPEPMIGSYTMYSKNMNVDHKTSLSRCFKMINIEGQQFLHSYFRLTFFSLSSLIIVLLFILLLIPLANLSKLNDFFILIFCC